MGHKCASKVLIYIYFPNLNRTDVKSDTIVQEKEDISILGSFT